MRSAVVVGAGIGGLAAAGALARTGWQVTLLERGDRLRGDSAALLLWPNGVRALHALGPRRRARRHRQPGAQPGHPPAGRTVAGAAGRRAGRRGRGHRSWCTARTCTTRSSRGSATGRHPHRRHRAHRPRPPRATCRRSATASSTWRADLVVVADGAGQRAAPPTGTGVDRRGGRLRRVAGGHPVVPGAAAARGDPDDGRRYRRGDARRGSPVPVRAAGGAGLGRWLQPGRDLLGGDGTGCVPAGAGGDPARPAAPLVHRVARAHHRPAGRDRVRAT